MSILFLVLIGFVFYKLYKSFGNVRYVKEEDILKKFDDIFNGAKSGRVVVVETPDSEADEIYFDASLKTKIAKLKKIFADFDPKDFLEFANESFSRIFDAFSKSHHDALKMRLSDSLYEKFDEQIQKREALNFRQEFKINEISSTIKEINVIDNEAAEIEVEYNVEQMSALVDIDGKSLDNPNRIFVDVLHNWLFRRSRTDNHWVLVKTSSAYV